MRSEINFMRNKGFGERSVPWTLFAYAKSEKEKTGLPHCLLVVTYPITVSFVSSIMVKQF